MNRPTPPTLNAMEAHRWDVPWRWIVWLLICWVTFPVAAPGADSTDELPPGELVSIEMEGPPDRPRVHFKFTHHPGVKSFALTDPDRIVVNFTPCRLKVSSAPAIQPGALERLRYAQFSADTVRVVLDLSQKAPYSLYTQEGETFRVSLELIDRTRGKTEDRELRPDNAHRQRSHVTAGKGGSHSGVEPRALAGPPARTHKSAPPRAAGESLKKLAAERDGGEKSIGAPTGKPADCQDLTQEMKALAKKGAHREVIRRYRFHRRHLQEAPDADLLILTGNSFRALGLFDPALDLFQTAWQGEAQGSPGLILHWAGTLVEKEDYATALPLIRNLVNHPAAAPDQQWQGYRLLAFCLYRQNLHSEAYKTLEAARARFPKMVPDAEFLLLEGMTAFEIPGLGRKAQTALEGLVTLNPESRKKALAQERLGDLFFGEKRYLDAWRAYYQAYRHRAAKDSPFLVKKLTQCRLLTEEKKPGVNTEKGIIESDLFWNKLYEVRFNQKQLEKQVGALRLP